MNSKENLRMFNFFCINPIKAGYLILNFKMFFVNKARKLSHIPCKAIVPSS